MSHNGVYRRKPKCARHVCIRFGSSQALWRSVHKLEGLGLRSHALAYSPYRLLCLIRAKIYCSLYMTLDIYARHNGAKVYDSLVLQIIIFAIALLLMYLRGC